MPNARDFALFQLDRINLPGWKTNQLRQQIDPPVDPRDLSLAEQIRMGVIKNHGLLEHLLEHYSSHPGRIDPLVRKIVAIGLYQLRFLTRIPPSAAVDEAVEQARRFGRKHGAGFVNAVLRRAAREPDVPLPNAKDNPEKYAEVVLSHPPELFRRLVDLLGTEKAIGFCEHNNTEPPTLVRAFQEAAFPPAELSPELRVRPHDQPGIFVVESGKRATFADWAVKGLAQVQDATAARVAEHLDIRPGQQIMDRCAGMGTKTLQMRDYLGNQGWIMAVDPSEPRCDALRSLLATRMISNVAVVQASMVRQVVDLKPPAFDRILVDVPCSNSGVLARRPEARYTQTPQALASLVKLQDQIMDDTADYLRPGGLLIYSTCSVWPEENEHRISRFLDTHSSSFEQLDAELTRPSPIGEPTRYRDGGFFAVLRRR